MTINFDKLKNGLKIATVSMKNIQSVSLGIWIKVGSRNELPNQNGVAHLLEHMLFKGTENRSALQIVTDIENVGGEIKAATSIETTCYFVRVLYRDIILAIDILCDMVTHPKFLEDDLKKEKNVIFEEINTSCDMPDDIIFDHFFKIAFREQMIGRPILGTCETIKKISINDLYNFMKQHYVAKNMVVVAVGSVDHDSFIKEIEKRLQNVPSNSNCSPLYPAKYVGGELIENRNLLETQILVGFQGYSYNDQDIYSAKLLSMILGGGMSSRLYQKIRENHGLCYYISSFHIGFSDTGLFIIQAATNKRNVEKLLLLIIHELHSITYNIDDQEINRVLLQYYSNHIMDKERPEVRSDYIARKILYNDNIFSIQKIMKHLALINSQKLMSLSKNLFIKTHPTFVATGKIDSLVSFQELKLDLEKNIIH